MVKKSKSIVESNNTAVAEQESMDDFAFWLI